ncbi:hypothetical protein [Roseofilum sp. Guam]|uniref:hypothetical protein n=1 Tax=Roseofilum sp. Guam TaxID=2821502 RepID=UPI001B0AD707|nr:hypothetical protein [Roseofilum sp. Guam]MBP0031044.1 hypothetical protein [Roseofilum sp. Guam]
MIGFREKLRHSPVGLGLSLVSLLTVNLSVAVLPVIAQTHPLVSQLFPDADDVVIPEGVILPMVYDRTETVVIAPDETFELVLTIPDNITSRQGQLLIPKGSQVRGALQPIAGNTVGTRFVAEELILVNGSRLPLDAVSRRFTETEQIGRSRATSVLRGAAIGAGAATILAGITGDRAIATEEILGGAGLGALTGVFLGGGKSDVFVIDPNTDLDLRLRSDLRISTRTGRW